MLNDSSNEECKFSTKNVIDGQTTEGKYNQNSSIKFETEIIKSSLCDYFDAFILVTGDITVTADNNTDVAFKIYAFLHARQKLMMRSLLNQIIFTLQCLCTTWSNIV